MRMMLAVVSAILVSAAASAVTAQELVDQANSYDNAWEAGADGWVACMRNVNDGFTGTAGLVIQVGDSITYANPATQWIRYGIGRTAEDDAVRAYMHVDAQDTTDGVYLAYHDVPSNRSYTAETSMDTAEYLGSPPYGLPNCNSMFVTGTGTDGAYNDFTGGHAAAICILMLGTNDVEAGHSADQFRQNIETIVTRIMQTNNTVAVLTTIPPRRGEVATVQSYNAKIRDLAQNGLVVSGLNGGNPVTFPLIDYYEEIIARRSSDWDGTLISGDGVHPSASYGGTDADSDPYAGDGAALADSGYLLRCFVYVQKIKEVRDYVIDRSKDPAVVADAGPGQTVPVGLPVTLDGTGSVGETSRTWTVVGEPGGSSVFLNDPGVESPTFTPTVAGDYVFQLEVTDGTASDTDTVLVQVMAAEADAGGPLSDCLIAALVDLTGAGSPSPATYAWTIEGSPSGSAASIQGASSLQADFTPDVWGTYVFMLTVTYGTSQATDTVTLTVHSVVADAGEDRQVGPGTLVTLDGSASLGGARIQSYTWSELTATGVAVTPSGTDPAKAAFTAGESGAAYEFELLVESTDGESSQDAITVTVAVKTGTRSTAGCAACGGTAARGGWLSVILAITVFTTFVHRNGARGSAGLLRPAPATAVGPPPLTPTPDRKRGESSLRLTPGPATTSLQ